MLFLEGFFLFISIFTIMAKKKTKKKVISKTEKLLKGKRTYQVAKKRKLYNELTEIENILKKTKVSKIVNDKKFYKIDTLSKKLQKNIKDKLYKKDSKVNELTLKTLKDIYYNKIFIINTEIDNIEQKIEKRFKKAPKINKRTTKKDITETQFELGKAWQIDSNIKPLIFDFQKIKTVNNFDKIKQAYEILKSIEIDKLNMGRYDIMYLIGDLKNGNFRTVIQNQEFNLDDENI